jgi:hypothetical protein
MKSNLALINSLGFINNFQKVWYFANILEGALTSSPKIAVSTAVAAVVGKRALPAYAGFLTAVPAKTALQNTTGYAFGSIFPGRPEVVAVPASNGYAAVVAIPALAANPIFAIGVPVPAYPAVPARAAQIEVVPVTAVAAVDIPAIAALPGYENMVICTATATTCSIEAYLPFSESPKTIGKTTKGVSNIGLITADATTATVWFDDKASNIPTTLVSIKPTVEQCLYESALAIVAADSSLGSIETVNVTILGKTIAAHKILLNLPATSYDPTGESIQLGKLGN